MKKIEEMSKNMVNFTHNLVTSMGSTQRKKFTQACMLVASLVTSILIMLSYSASGSVPASDNYTSK